MERPFLTLGSKEFITGIAPAAHSISGGLFYKAKGVTALAGMGTTESVDNGLLRGGLTFTDYSGSVVLDGITCGVKDIPAATSYLYMLGDAGHFYQFDGSTVTDLRSGNLIANPSNGIFVFQPFGGTKYLYYMQQGMIGRWDMTGTYPTGWVDNQYTTNMQTTTMHPTHRYYNKVFFGNKDRIGSIKDAGSGAVAYSANDLQFPSNFTVTAISDDGVYVVIAVTDNNQFSPSFGDTRIIFWDGSDTLWLREYPVDEPFIVSLKRVGNTVIAQGQRGLYNCAIGGVTKILDRFSGLGSTSAAQLVGPSLSSSYNGAYMFAHSDGGAGSNNCIATLGKVSEGFPSAYMEPIVSNPMGFIEPNFKAANIYVAGSNKLYGYSIGNSTTGATGVSAQTVYIKLPNRITLKRVDVIFGEPLVSGDSFSAKIYVDEDHATPTTLGTASFAVDGAIKRKSFFVPVTIEKQLSALFSFDAGLPKVASMEFYADTQSP